MALCTVSSVIDFILLCEVSTNVESRFRGLEPVSWSKERFLGNHFSLRAKFKHVKTTPIAKKGVQFEANQGMIEELDLEPAHAILLNAPTL